MSILRISVIVIISIYLSPRAVLADSTLAGNTEIQHPDSLPYSGQESATPSDSARIAPSVASDTADTFPLDSVSGVLKWVKRHWGWSALVAIVLVLLGLRIWTKWGEVSKWPGVTELKDLLTRGRLPVASKDRFTVLVARLKNDDDRSMEEKIIESLNEMPGIACLRLNRPIQGSRRSATTNEKRERITASRVLEQTGAQVLIWGVLLRQGEREIPKLRFQTQSGAVEKVADRYPLNEADLRLPEVFWADLSAILKLVVVTANTQFLNLEGHPVAEALSPYVARVKELWIASATAPGWEVSDRAQVGSILASSMTALGEQGGENGPLFEAVELHRSILAIRAREREPLDWATTQNNLGNTLSILGERESETDHLEEAVVAYRAALEEFTRESTPLDWAMVQNNLGNANCCLGERESKTERLEEAVVAFRLALQERTRERVPLKWAMTQNNLGNALYRLGERVPGLDRLEEAAAAYRAALQVYTRERVPLNWATIQSNLGSALQVMGERQAGTQRLEEAVVAFRAALEEYTRERVPLDWAMAQNNLGNALYRLGQREPGSVRLEEAATAYRAALEEYTRERVPLDWAMTQNNLGNVLAAIGERDADVERMCCALECHLNSWRTFAFANHANARVAASGVSLDIATLRQQFSPKAVETCLTHNAALVEKFRQRETTTN